jgi:hypothetical protein
MAAAGRRHEHRNESAAKNADVAVVFVRRAPWRESDKPVFNLPADQTP